MPRAVMVVYSYPSSPEQTDEYNHWYDHRHLQEVCAVPGVVSARRCEPSEPGGPYLALYELDAPDPDEVVKAIARGAMDGTIDMSGPIRMDPPPSMQVFVERSSHP